MNNLRINTAQLNQAQTWLHRSAALAQLQAELGSEIVDVVERMHGSISQKPWPFSPLQNEHTRGLTSFVYACVKGGFTLSQTGLKQLTKHLPPATTDEPGWLQFRAILNGVVGDTLSKHQNPLALPMSFEQATPAPTANSNTLLLFIHGLCMHEAGWQIGAHPKYANALATQLNARTAYLRYNSGKHISENGQELAQQLEEYAQDDTRIVIIGHSMGGLLTRSACHYAQQHGLNWPQKLTHIATLGTPHHGAPLERAGNLANTQLLITPYSKPLMRLGNLRSAGIKDLRFGNLLDSDWRDANNPDHTHDTRTPVPQLPHTHYLLIAGTQSIQIPDNPRQAKHDQLVTVASAWGQSRNNQHHWPDHPHITRTLLPSITHIPLISTDLTYQKIIEWIS